MLFQVQVYMWLRDQKLQIFFFHVFFIHAFYEYL